MKLGSVERVRGGNLSSDLCLHSYTWPQERPRSQATDAAVVMSGDGLKAGAMCSLLINSCADDSF